MSAAQKITQYANLVRQWAPRLSLVSRADLGNLEQRHINDSLSVVPHVPQTGVLYDWGSGAGFPAIIIAISRPQLQVHLVESDGKKCTFLRQVAHELQLPNVQVLQRRIEELDFSTHTQPIIVTARALSSLDMLLQYMQQVNLPPHSYALFLKGHQHNAEIAQAQQKFNFGIEILTAINNPHNFLLRINNVSVRLDESPS